VVDNQVSASGARVEDKIKKKLFIEKTGKEDTIALKSYESGKYLELL
jgi:hypothetical protein